MNKVIKQNNSEALKSQRPSFLRFVIATFTFSQFLLVSLLGWMLRQYRSERTPVDESEMFSVSTQRLGGGNTYF